MIMNLWSLIWEIRDHFCDLDFLHDLVHFIDHDLGSGNSKITLMSDDVRSLKMIFSHLWSGNPSSPLSSSSRRSWAARSRTVSSPRRTEAATQQSTSPSRRTTSRPWGCWFPYVGRIFQGIVARRLGQYSNWKTYVQSSYSLSEVAHLNKLI